MNSQINAVLTQIREKLNESAWGPQLPDVADTSHLAGEPGEHGAENVEDSEDVLDMYLSSMVDHIMQHYDADEEEAADVVFQAIEDKVSEGELPDMPDEGAPEAELSAWLGKAKSLGLQHAVVELARKAMQ